MIIIIYIVIMSICIYFIWSSFWAYDKQIFIAIISSTLLLYILIHFLIPTEMPANYASDFLGASFPVELILCATPSILILGLAGIINSIKWKIKEGRKRSR